MPPEVATSKRQEEACSHVPLLPVWCLQIGYQLMSEAVTQRKLKRPRATGSKEATRGGRGLVKVGSSDVVHSTRIVVVILAANVRHIEDVERFGDQIHLVALKKAKPLGNAEIQ